MPSLTISCVPCAKKWRACASFVFAYCPCKHFEWHSNGRQDFTVESFINSVHEFVTFIIGDTPTQLNATTRRKLVFDANKLCVCVCVARVYVWLNGSSDPYGINNDNNNNKKNRDLILVGYFMILLLSLLHPCNVCAVPMKVVHTNDEARLTRSAFMWMIFCFLSCFAWSTHDL